MCIVCVEDKENIESTFNDEDQGITKNCQHLLVSRQIE